MPEGGRAGLGWRAALCVISLNDLSPSHTCGLRGWVRLSQLLVQTSSVLVVAAQGWTATATFATHGIKRSQVCAQPREGHTSCTQDPSLKTPRESTHGHENLGPSDPDVCPHWPNCAQSLAREHSGRCPQTPNCPLDFCHSLPWIHSPQRPGPHHGQR